MSKSLHPFRTIFRSILKDAAKNKDTEKNFIDTMEKLEAAAVEMFGPTSSFSDDGMGPPKKKVRVECTHCRSVYFSSEMTWAYRPMMQAMMVNMLGKETDTLDPMWWCKNIRCDGAGFNFDIRPKRKKL